MTGMEKDLLPCPHCGSIAHLYHRPPMPMGGCDDWGVRCEKTIECGAEISAYGNFKPETAVAKWNRRAALEAKP